MVTGTAQKRFTVSPADTKGVKCASNGLSELLSADLNAYMYMYANEDIRL